MDFNELENYLTRLPEQILEDAAEIVAETAVDYYQDSFRKKHSMATPGLRPKRQGQTVRY